MKIGFASPNGKFEVALCCNFAQAPEMNPAFWEADLDSEEII